MDLEFQDVMRRVAQLGELSQQEAQRIFQHVYSDGIVSVSEAEALFRIRERLASLDGEWNERFAGAVKDFLLTRQPPEGWITEDEARWLISQIGDEESEPGLDDVDLLLFVLRYADGAPVSLTHFALSVISRHVARMGKIESEMVERIRRALFAPGGDSGIWVSRAEATMLFEINDSVAFAKNDPSWNDLFARAIGNHLLASAHPAPMTEEAALSREAWLSETSTNPTGFLSKVVGSFSSGNWFAALTYDTEKARRAQAAAREAAQRAGEQVTDDENAWFLKRLGWDQKISPAERELVEFLKTEAPGFAAGLAAAA